MRIVFTGPPCSGKSSVLEYFKAINSEFDFVDEVARDLISFYKDVDETRLPWNDRENFQALVETTQLFNWWKYPRAIFDRALPDEIAYRAYFEMRPSFDLEDNCHKYRYDMVFFFPYWPEIYKQDSVRIETIEEAKEQDMLLYSAYKLFGYNVIEVPQSSVKERVQFVTDEINSFTVQK